MFRVGQKAVCVSYWPQPGSPGDDPSVGGIYTITKVVVRDCGLELGMLTALEFAELHQPGDENWWPGYCAEHFRPLTERKANMKARRELFKQWKNTQPADIREDEQV